MGKLRLLLLPQVKMIYKLSAYQLLDSGMTALHCGR
jgi:hypothetical protein